MSTTYWETISPTMHEIMRVFGKSQIAEHFYLAGGTALALQIGHRRSINLDFFSPDLDISSIAEGVSLASLTDIGLMKLDALLARASRKDFHDLYAICQHMPLRSLLDVAQVKFAHVRDFEAQAVRHLIYFERAEQEAPVPLIEEVSWEHIKEYF
jgi:hypothetical protein